MGNVKDVIRKVVAENLIDLNKKYKFDIPENIDIDLPKKEEYGDYSTPALLKIAKQNKLNPIELGGEFQKIISEKKYNFFEKVEFYKPGFINFFISDQYMLDNLQDIYFLKDKYGYRENQNPDKINIEFVSANPTGPLNVVSARAAAVGDILTKLFKLNGHEVTKEYYINDAGRQVNLLVESVLVRIKEHLGEDIKLDEEHYHGEYIKDIAKEIIDNNIYNEDEDRSEILKKIMEYSLDKLINSQKTVLNKFNVKFDNWFKESKLRESDSIKKCYDHLEKKDLIFKEYNKTFFKSTEFGDEKDRVIIRDNDTPTYFFVDIAYHLDKINRGFSKIIDLWGPDHDGYMTRMKGAMQSFDYDDNKFQIIIIQQVNLLEKSQKVQMSKRLGTFVLMDDLINDIGIDASRFFFIHRSISSHLDFDMDLARKQSDENPVFYVQYAYARICNIFKQAENKNIKAEYILDKQNWDILKEEKKLMKKLSEYPVIIQDASERIQPNLLPNYLIELSSIFHQFYTVCHVLNAPEKPIVQNRLFLAECTRQVLKNGLEIIGVSAPERM